LILSKGGDCPSFVPPENHFSSKKFLRFLEILSVKYLSQNKHATPCLRKFVKKNYIFSESIDNPKKLSEDKEAPKEMRLFFSV